MAPKDRRRRYRLKMLTEHRCIRCGKTPRPRRDGTPSIYCEYHHQKTLEGMRRYHLRQREKNQSTD